MRMITFGISQVLSLILAASSVFSGFPGLSVSLPVRVDGFGIEMSALPTLDADNIEPLMNKVKSAGADYIRQEINWSEIETSPDVYDWSAAVPLDLLFASASVHHIKIVATLTGGPTYLASRGEPIDPAALLERWDKFVQAAADHFGGYIDIWEIGTAINGNQAMTPFLSPLSPDKTLGPDPALYSKLLRSAARIIRNVDPNDRVWLGSLTGISADNCAMSPLTFILEVNAAKGWNYMDAILYQPDQGSEAPEFPSSGTVNSACASNLMVTPANMTDEVQAVQDLARQLGGKPVIITGLGWSSDPLEALSSGREISSREVEADLLVRASAALMSQNSIATVFWRTDISNNPSSFNALANLQKLLHDARPLGQLKGQEESVFAYRFRNGGEFTILAWRVRDGDVTFPVELAVGDIPSLTAWVADTKKLGRNAATKYSADDSNHVVISLNERPILLVGQTGDLVRGIRLSIKDQAELWQIQLRQTTGRWMNEAKADFMDLLEKEVNKLKDRAIEWGRDKLNEILPGQGI